MLFARLRLSTQLLILTVGTAALVIVLLVALAVFQTSTVVRQEGDQRLTALTQAMSDIVTPSLTTHDTAGVQRILSAVVRDEGLDRAFVLAPDGTIVAEQRGERVDDEKLSADDLQFALSPLRDGQLHTRDDTDNLVDIAVPIDANGQAIGVLLGQSSTSDALDELLGSTLPQMSAAGLGAALLAALVALAIARYIATPFGSSPSRRWRLVKDSLRHCQTCAAVLKWVHWQARSARWSTTWIRPAKSSPSNSALLRRA